MTLARRVVVQMPIEMLFDNVSKVQVVLPIVVPEVIADSAKHGDGCRALNSPLFGRAFRVAEMADSLSENGSPRGVIAFGVGSFVHSRRIP